jgi:hypothetical protein
MRDVPVEGCKSQNIYDPTTRKLFKRKFSADHIQRCVNNSLYNENSYLSTKQALDVAIQILKANDMWKELTQVMVQVNNLEKWREEFRAWEESVD